MPTPKAFNSQISTIVRIADAVRSTPAILADYENVGGAKADLDYIFDEGTLASSFNTFQSATQGVAKQSTRAAVLALEDLRSKDYVMKQRIRALIHDLEQQGGQEALVAQLEKILANETEVHLYTTLGEGDAKKRGARKSQTQEAARNEIEKDGRALLDLANQFSAPVVAGPGVMPGGGGATNPVTTTQTSSVGPLFLTRKITVNTVKPLFDAATALAGKFAERDLKKGEKVKNTKGEREHAANAFAKFQSIHGLLKVVAAKHAALATLLAAL